MFCYIYWKTIFRNWKNMEELLNHPKLKQSRPDTVKHELLQELMEIKQWIEYQKEDWWLVAVVHLSGDLTHSAHIAYMNTIRAKLRKELWRPFKLLVWVESDERTEERKNKKNVFSQEERKYIFGNMKAVDKAYIEFEHLDEQTNEMRPCWIIQFLEPDIMVSHEEHLMSDDEQVRERMKKQWWDLIVVKYWDEDKYWVPSFRNKMQRSTTETIKQILALYKDHPKYQ